MCLPRMSSIYSCFTWKRNTKRLFTLALIISTLTVLYFVKVFSSTSASPIVNVARNYDIHAGNPDSGTTDWDNLLESTTLTGAQIMQYFKWSNRQSCQLVNDFGGTMRENPSGWDGQKSVCLDPEVAPKSGDCLVYSFGIKNEWSFDEQMSAYGCQVYAFDPSMAGELDHYDHNPGRVHFYKWGLGDRDKHDADYNWTIRSLSSIYETLSARHGRRIIDYLKIDVEFDEWIALPEIISSGMLSNVRQLAMEVHMDFEASLEQHRQWAKLLRSIEKLGMIRFDSEYNPWYVGNFVQIPLEGPLGYEIGWYNGNLSIVNTTIK